jgi:hypothetical protein
MSSEVLAGYQAATRAELCWIVLLLCDRRRRTAQVVLSIKVFLCFNCFNAQRTGQHVKLRVYWLVLGPMYDYELVQLYLLFDRVAGWLLVTCRQSNNGWRSGVSIVHSAWSRRGTRARQARSENSAIRAKQGSKPA